MLFRPRHRYMLTAGIQQISNPTNWPNTDQEWPRPHCIYASIKIVSSFPHVLTRVKSAAAAVLSLHEVDICHSCLSSKYIATIRTQYMYKVGLGWAMLVKLSEFDGSSSVNVVVSGRSLWWMKNPAAVFEPARCITYYGKATSVLLVLLCPVHERTLSMGLQTTPITLALNLNHIDKQPSYSLCSISLWSSQRFVRSSSSLHESNAVSLSLWKITLCNTQVTIITPKCKETARFLQILKL